MEKNYKKKTLISTFSLFFQSGYSAVLGFLANLILTIIVSPSVFGIYITVLSIIAIFNYFSDIGLAAALIQKKEIDNEDLKTSFTCQQILVVFLIIIGFFLTSFIKNFYHLPPNGIYLYHAVLIGFFLSSLKTIPSVLLERKIEFQKIVLVQMVENTFFYLIVIVLALLKFEILSFAFAIILRSLIGLILIYRLSFWLPKIGFNSKSFRKLVSFGLPFQTNSLLALIKDDFLILYLGKILGFEKLGYIGFAKKWAEAPIRIIMDNLSRVSFPLIARFQEEKGRLKSIIEKIIFYQSLIILPATAGLILILPLMIKVIPKYQKWEPAIDLFYLFAMASVFSSFSTPFVNFFNGIGKIKITFSLMIFWTLSTWILTPILTQIFDIFGFPLTLFFLSLTFIYIIYLTKKIVNFDFFKQIIPSFFSTLMMIIFVILLQKINFLPTITLTFSVILGIIIYTISLIFIFKINPIKIYRSFYE